MTYRLSPKRHLRPLPSSARGGHGSTQVPKLHEAVMMSISGLVFRVWSFGRAYYMLNYTPDPCLGAKRLKKLTRPRPPESPKL